MDPVLKFFLGAAIASLCSGWIVYPLLLRWNVIDRPNERSSHARPTARGGGAGFVAVIIGVGIWQLVTSNNESGIIIYLSAGVLAVVSFIDDLRTLPAGIRFGCHALAAGGAIWFLDGVAASANVEVSMPVRVAVMVLLFFWITGYTNAFNFMDGINGISGQQGLISAGGAVLVVYCSGTSIETPGATLLLLIAGACLGFLPHNFPRARMFMGDVGSAPLGYLLAVGTIWLALETKIELLPALLLLHANYVLDTGITLARRALRGDKWYTAHREHFYQRLIRSGRSHTCVTLMQASLLLISTVLLASYSRLELVGRVFLAATVIGIWLVFFLRAEFEFNRHRAGTDSV
ncbi:MAG: MraY family glycosyltransferase [Limisphaerales bacterium]